MTIRGVVFPHYLLTASTCVVLSGCSKGAEQQRMIARADTLLHQQKLPEAVAEYEKAVASDDKNPQANARLGVARLRLGQFVQGYQYLLNAKSLQPDNLDNRLDLATYYLIAAKAEQARDEALTVLDKEPTNLRALRLYAASATTPRDQARAAKALEGVKDKVDKDTAAHLVLTGLYLRQGDTVRSKREQAGLSEFGAPASDGRVSRALDYASVGRREDAKRILREVIQGDTDQRDPSAAAAARLLAFMSVADGDADEAVKVVAPVLAKDANDIDALAARGEARLFQKQPADAMQDFRVAIGRDKNLAPLHYDMAVAYMQQANAVKEKPAQDSALKSANRELQTALRLANSYTEAVLQLAALRAQGGAPAAAISDLESFVRENPHSIRARTLLGSALMAAGRTSEADETFRQILKISPSNAEAHYWIGMMQLRKGNREDAKAQLDTAATLSPTFIEPISQLAGLMIAEGDANAAFTRVKRQIDLAASAPLYDLLGIVNLSRRDMSGAEVAFIKATQLDPRLVDPHVRLAEFYLATGKYDEAINHALETLKLDPANAPAMMTAGTAYQQKGEAVNAKAQYQNVLKLNPKNAGAANNLAVLLSEELQDLDGALTYGRLAQQLAPADPHIEDTIGWILYQRRSFEEAAKLLRDSAERLPDSPTVLYHFGMVAQQTGDVAGARQALTKAVSSPVNFNGKDDARRALAQLK